MTLCAGLDLNAGRVRAVGGLAAARPLPLDEDASGDLRLAISLENRRLEVGRTALQLCRRLPHLACVNFLPHLGDERRWAAGRHRLDAAQALTLVLKKLQARLADVTGAALALPVYLSREQLTQVSDLAKTVKLPLLGRLPTPLAIAWSASGQQHLAGPALVLDVDDYALTWTALTVDDTPQARMLAVQTVPALGLTAWKRQLLDSIAHRCIRQSRRDLRDSGEAEQLLWDQFDTAMDVCRRGQLIELIVRTERWYQDIVLRPGEFEEYAGGLVRQCIGGLRELLKAVAFERPPTTILATAAAARLPGLLRTLTDQSPPQTQIRVLAPDAVAQAAQELAVRWHDGSLKRGPIDTTLTVKKSAKVNGALSRTEFDHNTKLPARGAQRPRSADDDFSVTIEE